MQNELFHGKLDFNLESGWQEVRALFVIPHKVLILTHKNPDGDAIGSALGLKWVLLKLGHTVDIIIPDDAPSFLIWLPGHNEVIVKGRKSDQSISRYFDECELVICSDFNTPERLGSLEESLRKCVKPKLLIDHHPVYEQFTDVQLIDPQKGSASEMVFLFLEKLLFTELIGPEAATCLLAGIMTDTVGLKVASSYPEIYETVAKLIRLGADKDRIYFEVYNMFSTDRMRLLGYSLEQNMKVLPEFRAAYIALSKNDLKNFRHKKGDTEGFVNYPLSIANVIFSVLFTEQTDHIKLSLRSRGNFPANEFAKKYFNGGGHRNAAGGRYSGTLQEAIGQFESALIDYKELLHAES
ncbi:MAG: bifunctional oligoribonuclease/PAP phosphatase NrnA [Bacteroidales bacterium]|nr:bifunctional oligoribonuclease/PAP phosphatase NrnA [Bacteroidales bacterium]